jgi:hypothetical protein
VTAGAASAVYLFRMFTNDMVIYYERANALRFFINEMLQFRLSEVWPETACAFA